MSQCLSTTLEQDGLRPHHIGEQKAGPQESEPEALGSGLGNEGWRTEGVLRSKDGWRHLQVQEIAGALKVVGRTVNDSLVLTLPLCESPSLRPSSHPTPHKLKRESSAESPSAR